MVLVQNIHASCIWLVPSVLQPYNTWKYHKLQDTKRHYFRMLEEPAWPYDTREGSTRNCRFSCTAWSAREVKIEQKMSSNSWRLFHFLFTYSTCPQKATRERGGWRGESPNLCILLLSRHSKDYKDIQIVGLAVVRTRRR